MLSTFPEETTSLAHLDGCSPQLWLNKICEDVSFIVHIIQKFKPAPPLSLFITISGVIGVMVDTRFKLNTSINLMQKKWDRSRK